MTVRPWVAVVVAALASTGCVAADPAPADLTPAGIGAVVANHVEETPVDVAGWDVMTRELGVDAPGATVVVGRRDSLDVAVAPTTDSPLVCADQSFFDRCVDLDDDGSGGRVWLGWQELEPEEDPGIVYVIDRRDGEDVVVSYVGTSITGDPRGLDLGVSLEQMVAVATDQRLTLS